MPNRTCTTLRLATITASIALGGLGCSQSGATTTGQPCAAVFDVDGGTAAVPGLHDQYLTWFGDLARRCAVDGATITLLTASDHSLTDPNPVLRHDLAPQHAHGNRSDAALEAAANVARARRAAKDLVDEAASGPGGTDLLGALQVAADHLAPSGATTAEGRAAPHLVLYTDGLHTRPPYNLTAIPLDDASIAATIDVLRSTGQLPQLHGAEVDVVGAGVGADAAVVDPARMAAIEQFWRHLVAAAGGRLVAWNKAPVSR